MGQGDGAASVTSNADEALAPRRHRKWMPAVVIVFAVAALLLAAVAVATYVRETNHQNACQRYGDALAVVLANPQQAYVDPTSIAVLAPPDRQKVESARAAFRKAYNSTPQGSQAAAQLMPSWNAGADQFKHEALVGQGC